MEPVKQPYIGEDKLYHFQENDKGIKPRERLVSKIWGTVCRDYLQVTFANPSGAPKVIRVSAKSARDFINSLPKDTAYTEPLKAIWSTAFPRHAEADAGAMHALNDLSGRIQELAGAISSTPIGGHEEAGDEPSLTLASIITSKRDAIERLEMVVSEFEAQLQNLTEDKEYLLLKSIWDDYQIRPKNKPKKDLAAEVRKLLVGMFDTMQSINITVEALESLLSGMPKVQESVQDTCEIFLERSHQFEKQLLIAISKEKRQSLKTEWRKTRAKIETKGFTAKYKTLQHNEAKRAFEEADLTKAAEALSSSEYAAASAILLQMTRGLRGTVLALPKEEKQRLTTQKGQELALIRKAFPVTRQMSVDGVCVELSDKIIALCLGGFHKQLKAILQHTPLSRVKERELLTKGLHDAQSRWQQANASTSVAQ